MSRTIATILTISFIGIAIFGFLGIEFMNGHHASCIVSTASGSMCPDSESPLGFINFHFNALKNFSTAVSPSFILLALSLVLILSFAFGLLREKLRASRITTPRPSGRALLDFRPPLQAQFTHWLSLHENSPSLF